MQGRFCRLEAVDPARHGEDLHAANQRDVEGRSGPTCRWGRSRAVRTTGRGSKGRPARTIPSSSRSSTSPPGRPTGLATYMRIDRSHGAIEVGNINYSPLLQSTPAATEAMFLMMARGPSTSRLPSLRVEMR